MLLVPENIVTKLKEMKEKFTLCNIMARKTINWRSCLSVLAAAPKATPSAAAWTTKPIVAVCVLDFESLFWHRAIPTLL